MKVPNITPKLPSRETLHYKYLNPDYSVQAVLTLDKKTKEFISYQKYTKENPYRGEYDTFNDKPIKAKPIRHKPGDEFTTKYLNKDLKTVDIEVKYRWIDDNEYEVVEVKKFSQNETK